MAELPPPGTDVIINALGFYGREGVVIDHKDGKAVVATVDGEFIGKPNRTLNLDAEQIAPLVLQGDIDPEVEAAFRAATDIPNNSAATIDEQGRVRSTRDEIMTQDDVIRIVEQERNDPETPWTIIPPTPGPDDNPS